MAAEEAQQATEEAQSLRTLPTRQPAASPAMAVSRHLAHPVLDAPPAMAARHATVARPANQGREDPQGAGDPLAT